MLGILGWKVNEMPNTQKGLQWRTWAPKINYTTYKKEVSKLGRVLYTIFEFIMCLKATFIASKIMIEIMFHFATLIYVHVHIDA